jgi:ABC-type branched-subunit amino acid transport system permease subunit
MSPVVRGYLAYAATILAGAFVVGLVSSKVQAALERHWEGPQRSFILAFFVVGPGCFVTSIIATRLRHRIGARKASAEPTSEP